MGTFAQQRAHLADPLAEHQGQMSAHGRDGAMIVFDGIAGHVGTASRSRGPRRPIQSFQPARRIEQRPDQAHWIWPAAITELSPAARVLVHV